MGLLKPVARRLRRYAHTFCAPLQTPNLFAPKKCSYLKEALNSFFSFYFIFAQEEEAPAEEEVVVEEEEEEEEAPAPVAEIKVRTQ